MCGIIMFCGPNAASRLPKSESEIRTDIEGRFSSGVVYPFSNSLRFSLIVGSQFLFLRGDRLEIYQDKGFECLEGISDTPDTASSSAPFRLYNIGNDAPVHLMDVIEALESALGRTAQKNLLPQQPGDMRVTHADVHDLQRDVGYRPATELRDGIGAFADWFCTYYGVQRGTELR
jgi:nucleoside-diphosphate-sugar epimerase